MDELIDYRPDGSVAFAVDDDKIVWRPPKVKHLRAARNLQFDISNQVRELRDQIRELQVQAAGAKSEKKRAELATQVDADSRAMLATQTDLMIDWIVQVNDMLNIDGTLPSDSDEWPAWLPTLNFATGLIRHWGAHPFGSNNGATRNSP